MHPGTLYARFTEESLASGSTPRSREEEGDDGGETTDNLNCHTQRGFATLQERMDVERATRTDIAWPQH